MRKEALSSAHVTKALAANVHFFPNIMRNDSEREWIAGFHE
jgi:hypothetical protein